MRRRGALQVGTLAPSGPRLTGGAKCATVVAMTDGQPSIGGRIARAAVLVSSGTLAAALVLHSGPGCDGQPTAAPVAKPAAKPEPAPAQAQAAPELPATQAPAEQPARIAPVPADSKAAPVDVAAPANEGDVGAELNNPRYFPASKSGVFIERAPADPPPQQQAPRSGSR